MVERRHEFIVSIVLALYITAAVAFECTANTAKISTIGIYLVFVTGLIYLVSRGQFQKNEHSICLLLMLVYVYVMSIFNRNSLSDTVSYYCLTCTVLCLMSYNLYISTDRVQTTTICLLAFILGSLILAVRVVISYGGIYAMLSFTSSGENERRIGSLLTNENTLGLYMANAFFCSLFLFGKLKAKRPFFSFLILLTSPFFLVMLLLAASKKAILYLFFGFIFLIFYIFRRFHGSQRMIVLLATFLGIALVIYLIMYVRAFHSVGVRFSDMFDHLTDSSLGSSSDQNRGNMTSRGLSAFLDSPLFGNGTAFSFTLFGTYAHNNYVELLMDYGIIGFSIYYFPYIFLFSRLFSQTRNGDSYALYFLIFVTMQVVLGIAWVNYYDRITQLFTILAVGYSEMCTQEESKEKHTCKYLKSP